jgi:hypothetical protein
MACSSGAGDAGRRLVKNDRTGSTDVTGHRDPRGFGANEMAVTDPSTVRSSCAEGSSVGDQEKRRNEDEMRAVVRSGIEPK